MLSSLSDRRWNHVERFVSLVIFIIAFSRSFQAKRRYACAEQEQGCHSRVAHHRLPPRIVRARGGTYCCLGRATSTNLGIRHSSPISASKPVVVPLPTTTSTPGSTVLVDGQRTMETQRPLLRPSTRSVMDRLIQQTVKSCARIGP